MAALVERARETLPPCPQSAYASRVAPATSAWGWPPPPPCAAAPFTASPLLAPSPPPRSPPSSFHRYSSSSSSSSSNPSNLPPPFPYSPATRPSLAEIAASPRSNPRQSSPFYPGFDLVSSGVYERGSEERECIGLGRKEAWRNGAAGGNSSSGSQPD